MAKNTQKDPQNTPKMELKKALEIASKLVLKITPFCDQIDIAGSCRREKEIVKDIEICLISKKDNILFKKDLFSDPYFKKENIQLFNDIVVSLGKIEKGKLDGKYMKIVLPEEINLDLFMPDDFDYFRQYAIRTGSSDYSFKVLAHSWRKKGWCGSDVGLRKIGDCNETRNSEGKSIWKCINQKAEHPPVWKDEKEFFDWIGVKWIEPKYRNI